MLKNRKKAKNFRNFEISGRGKKPVLVMSHDIHGIN